MTASSEEREHFAVLSLGTAEDWRRKGDQRWELKILASAVISFLGVAVERFADVAEGIRFLEDKGVTRAIDRMAQLNRQFVDALHRNGEPIAGVVNNQAAQVHVAWLLGRWEIAQDQVAVCVDELVCEFSPLTAFWAEYCRALDCLAVMRPYSPVVPRTSGYERYWVPYLNLIADLTSGRPTEASRADIAESFAQRNRDKRLIDWNMIDGDGKHPVRWDFREVSILKFAEHCGVTNR